MVSTIRFRSFKTIDLQMRRPYTVLFLIAAGIMAIATHPRVRAGRAWPTRIWRRRSSSMAYMRTASGPAGRGARRSRGRRRRQG